MFADGIEVSARPSDAIALALRTGARSSRLRIVLERRGSSIPDEQEDEVERFREFLDQIIARGLRAREGRNLGAV